MFPFFVEGEKVKFRMNKAHGVPVLMLESQVGQWQGGFDRNIVAKSAFCKILRTIMNSERDSVFVGLELFHMPIKQEDGY